MVAALAAGDAGATSAPGVPRGVRAALQAAVEAAVTRVCRPAGLMFGRPSRAYHLKGYGAVVVLAPRALPRAHRYAGDGPEGRAFADLLARLQQSVAEVRDPAERRRLEETLAALRTGTPPGAPLRMLRMRPPRPRLAMPPREIESMQEDAEAFRRDAERAMERAERDVLVRLRVPEDGRPFAWIAPSEAPETPPVPDAAPPVPPVPPPTPRAAPAIAPVPPTPGVLPAIPPPPGWSFDFEEADAENLPPDRIVSDVRRAIVAGLGAYRGGLGLLGPDEFVVVAVDFVPRMADRYGTRTVVARARKRDLVEHRAGRLTAAGLHARIAFDEY